MRVCVSMCVLVRVHVRVRSQEQTGRIGKWKCASFSVQQFAIEIMPVLNPSLWTTVLIGAPSWDPANPCANSIHEKRLSSLETRYHRSVAVTATVSFPCEACTSTDRVYMRVSLTIRRWALSGLPGAVLTWSQAVLGGYLVASVVTVHRVTFFFSDW